MDELLEKLREMERLASRDQEELMRLQTNFCDSRVPEPACSKTTDNGLVKIFRNLAT